MAVTDRNIVITPNRTAVGSVQPKIVFTGADSNIGDSAAITLFANPDNSGTLSFSGTAGQLFSITNDLSGTIFSVNDVSGMPSLSINDQGIIELAEFNGRVLIGGASDDSASTLQVSGALTADSATITGNIKTRTALFSMNDEDSSNFATVVIGERNANDGIASVEFRNQSNTFSSKIDGAGSYFGVWTNKNSVNDYRIIANFGTADETIILKPSGTDRITANKYGATINGTVNADSATINKIHIPDGSSTQSRIAIGNDDDFFIYHDGQTVVANKNSTGPIKIQSVFGEQSIVANQHGAVDLHFNGNQKFETTDSGVNITGAIRVNNAPFTSGGTDSAAVIALIDSDYVQLRTAGTRGTLNNVNSRSFTGDNSTTAFALQVTPADSDDVFVFVNGVLQHTNSYSVSGNTVTLATAPDSSSTIDIRSHLIKSENVSLRDYKKYVYTLGSTVDSVSGADSAGATLTYDAGLVDVYVNGARLVTDKDYTAGNGSQVVFDSALGAGNIVEVVSHSRATVFTPEITSADVSLSTTDSGQNIDSFAKDTFRTYKFTAQISHAASSSFHSEEVLLVHNGTNVAMTTFGQVLLDSNLGSFDAFISGSNVQVKFSPTKTNTTVKLRGVRTPV